MRSHSAVDIRHVKLFKNGRSQAVRIPRDFELQGSEALIHREGNRLIVEPIASLSLTEVLATWQSLDEGLPDILDKEPDPVDL